MTIFNVISLFGGLALFLYGMRIMGDGLKQGSSTVLKQVLERVTNNQFLGFLLGLVVTALIQSSTATVVLTSGLVGAGIITLHQSIGIIIGANLGTTITGQIIRLLDISDAAAFWLRLLQPSTLAPAAAILGILMIMAFRFKNSDLIGTVAIGFGILFTGLLNMTAAVSPLSESTAFANLFVSLSDQPVLGYLAGAGVAFLIQSSSATIGILQALTVTGKLTFGAIYSIIIGIYLGDCVTTGIVCSIGASADAKRTGVMHVLYGIGKSILALAGVLILRKLGVFGTFWDAPITSGGIANTHTIFNLAAALILLPVCGIFENLSRVIVKDEGGETTETVRALDTLTPALFTSPELALEAVRNALEYMEAKARKNVGLAFDMVREYNEKTEKEIHRREDEIDSMADHISDYLVQLSTHVGPGSETSRLNYYIKCVSEFEHIGDMADNICKNASSKFERDAAFTEKAMSELKVLREATEEVLEHTANAFHDQSLSEAAHIEPVEEAIDDIVSTMRSNHFIRLANGECSIITGYIFLDMLTNMERISDQCANIGVHTIALRMPELVEAEHDYIHRLHQGEDPTFNQLYQMYTEKYTNRVPEEGKTKEKSVTASEEPRFTAAAEPGQI